MKTRSAKDELGRNLVRGINEAFLPGDERNNVADQYLKNSNDLHATPQAFVSAVPKLEPGDVLYVPLYEGGFFWDLDVVKVSLYSTSGAVLDKVIFKGGAVNNLSIPSQQRPEIPRPKNDGSIGPTFERLDEFERTELVLTTEKPTIEFETCIPVGLSYLTLGTKAKVESSQPLEAVAQGKHAFIALGPPKSTGRSLILVPNDSIEKVRLLEGRTPVPKSRPMTKSEKAKRASEEATIAKARAKKKSVVRYLAIDRSVKKEAVPETKSQTTSQTKRTGPQANTSTKPAKSSSTARPVPGLFRPVPRTLTLVLEREKEGSDVYHFPGCKASGSGAYRYTGKDVEVTIPAGSAIRAVAVGPTDYVAELEKPASDGSTLILVPMTSVKTTRGGK